MTGVPNASVGTVYLADGVTAVTNGMTLTSAELTGLVFRPVADAMGRSRARTAMAQFARAQARQTTIAGTGFLSQTLTPVPGDASADSDP